MTAGHEHEREDDLGIDEAELDLLAYLDGELEGERAAAVEARLRTDRAYAARYRAMQSIGQFLRGDADRIYGAAKVDAIADEVLEKVRASQAGAVAEPKPEPARLRVVEAPRLSDVPPPTSRLTRTKKNTVIWVVFGGVVAAAAAMIVWIGGQGAKGPAPVASAPSAPETVAVKTPAVPTSKEPVPAIPEPASTVEVEGLEVGEGATVVYTRGDDGSSPVVWITAREGAQ